MTLSPQRQPDIPPETARVVRQVFPKGNPYVQFREHLGVIYQDEQFAELFCSSCGQPAYSPGQLALVMVLQYVENLSDRQAAESVRSRLDWKYILGLELTDTGFHYSLLSEFRSRLIAGNQVTHLLDELLRVCQRQKLVKARGQQRTDSTHVLAAVRQLNRLECVGETLRQSLEILAQVVPDWLMEQIDSSWWERYSSRVEQAKLAPSKVAQSALMLQIGQDGHQLLTAVDESEPAMSLAKIPALQTLRRVWLQQYRVEFGQVLVRESKDLPPFEDLIQSPYDLEARNRTKRQTNWTGYSVHLSETCDAGLPHLITQVETTPATQGDSPVLPVIHQALIDKQLPPRIHLVDGGYFHSQHLVMSQHQGIDLVVPALSDRSWAAQEPQRFDIPCFQIDWTAQRVTCPMGQTSLSWNPAVHSDGHPVIRVNFSCLDCRPCERRADCLSGQNQARHLTLLPQPQFEALQAARTRQDTPEFRQSYRKRAGIEGTISQAVRTFALRRSRYIGLAKTQLQHVITATAINLVRLAAFFNCRPQAQTRTSHFARLKPAPTVALS